MNHALIRLREERRALKAALRGGDEPIPLGVAAKLHAQIKQELAEIEEAIAMIEACLEPERVIIGGKS